MQRLLIRVLSFNMKSGLNVLNIMMNCHRNVLMEFKLSLTIRLFSDEVFSLTLDIKKTNDNYIKKKKERKKEIEERT